MRNRVQEHKVERPRIAEGTCATKWLQTKGTRRSVGRMTWVKVSGGSR